MGKTLVNSVLALICMLLLYAVVTGYPLQFWIGGRYVGLSAGSLLLVMAGLLVASMSLSRFSGSG